MKTLPMSVVVVTVIAAILIGGGCSESDGPTGTDDGLYTREQIPDLDDPYGGYNFADEAPGFGDASLIDEFGDDITIDDPYENDPTIAVRERDRDGHVRGRLFLAITWGNLHKDPTIDHVTDWSGSLTVDPGAILLKQLIRFEREDHVMPRTDRGLLEWVSHTLPSFDGILVRIVAVPEATVDVQAEIDSANTVITFSTEPLTVSFTLADLPGLHRVVTLEDGNAVAFDAVYVPPVSCPRGFLRGVWRHHPEREGGEFFGKYVSEVGHHMGFVRGFYGVNEKDDRVFFGKWISRSGEFRGILRGIYDNHEGEQAGYFAGVWMGRDRRVHGDLRGEWRRNDDRHGGFFRGVWAARCPNAFSL
jgi:hypothetical protein